MRAFVALLSALWRYAEGRRAIVVLYVSMFVIANAINMFEPYVVGLVMNSLQRSAMTAVPLRGILTNLAILFSLTIGFWMFHGPARVLEMSTAFKIRMAFKDHLFNILTRLPAQWHKNHHSGQSINRGRKSSSALFEFSSNGFQLIEMLLKPAGSIVALFLIMPMAAAIALTVSTLALLIVFAFDRVLLPQYEAINDREHFEASAVHDYITNVMTVITLRLEALARSEVLKRMRSYFGLFRKNNVLNECKWFLTSAVIALMVMIVLSWYAVTSIHAGIVPLAGTFFMLYEYLQRIGGAFYTFAWKYGQTVQQYADLKAADEILTADRADYHAGHRLPNDWKEVRVEHLDFTYQDEEKERQHLSDVSITLGRSRKIAFVGESGSGKSTLMALIRGLHEADAEVSADGKRLPHGMKHLAPHVTLIPQEPEIFENTIEYNVTLDTDQSEEEILEDVRLARFASVLARLPKGLKTNIAEKGVNLSGGEKQRLALARGIFAAKESDIILLDEPTSSVDSVNERAIYENLFKKYADRCIVSSIHKLHLLPLFDEVVLFADGKVIDRGTPQEVTARMKH